MGTASFEEEKSVCRWVNEAKKNKETFLRERKAFDLILLHPDKYQEPAVKRQVSRSLFFVRIAAAIVLVAVSSVFLYHLHPLNEDRSEQASVELKNKIMVPPGQCVHVILSDGTKVWLNARTELIYPSSFTGQRKVELNGEAYFEVAKDVRHPFIIHTRKHDLHVLGTTFNVEAYADREEFSAALIEGAVEITNRHHSQPTVVLTPQLEFREKQGICRIDSIQDYDIYRWREGLICFDNMAFPELMKKMEKNYGFRILIRNKKMENYVCSGKFRMSDGIDFILRVLQRNARFTFSRDEEQSVIYIY